MSRVAPASIRRRANRTRNDVVTPAKNSADANSSVVEDVFLAVLARFLTGDGVGLSAARRRAIVGELFVQVFLVGEEVGRCFTAGDLLLPAIEHR